MKQLLIFLGFSASLYSLEVNQKLTVPFDPLVRMEMGMARFEQRSNMEACCDCTLNPDQYIRVATQTLPLVYLVDTTWNILEHHNQTAFLPMIYASAMALNGASIVRTLWQGFRESKFKEKED